MKHLRKRVGAIIMSIAMIVGILPVNVVFAADNNILNVSEIAMETLTSAKEYGIFTVMASSDKSVTIDANSKTADDGEAFTQRLKLGGTGTAEARSVMFTAAAGAKLTVYCMSSSSSADRVLTLYKLDGTEVISANAPGSGLAKSEIEIKEAGDYYLASPSSGVNIYCLKLESSSSAEVKRADWANVKAPVIKEVVQNGNNIDVKFELVTDNDNADKATVTMYDSTGKEIETMLVGKSADSMKTASFTMTTSGEYSFKVTGQRNNETSGKDSETVKISYVLPLTAPVVTLTNAGNGSLSVKWTETKEAEKYTISVKAPSDKDYVQKAETKELKAVVEGLTVGTEYSVKVTAVRGTDLKDSEAVAKKVKQEKEREWNFTYFGQSIKADLNKMEMIDEENLKFKLYSCSTKADGSIDKKGGKFTTFHDGVTFYYTEIDADKENFELTATFTIDYINPTADGQEGFGLLAMDSLGEYGVSSSNHYTNSAAIIATKFEETIDGVKYSSKDTLGARFVSGITEEVLALGDTGIAEKGKNVSHGFAYGEENLVKQGQSYTITLKKTNTGYHAIYGDKEYIMYGVDKLLQLDKEKIYVGFAVARGCNATVSDISMKITDPATDPAGVAEPEETEALVTKIDSPETYSKENYKFVYASNADGKITVKDSKGNVVVKESDIKANVDFIAELKLIGGKNDFTVEFTPTADFKINNLKLSSYDKVTKNLTITYRTFDGDTIYVSKDGKESNKGTKDSPVDIYTAVNYAKAGQTVILAGGEYMLTSKFIIARGNDGKADSYKALKSEDGQRAVLNFKNANGGMQLWGSYWHIYGIDICNTPGNIKGLQVAGHYNVVELVNTYNNGDTGLQISGTSAESYEKWPSNNLILNCTSYDNCDPGMNNADGFSAKITVADGNVFRGCIAHHNLDDGWDLFAKIESGPIGIVTVDNCIAYANGTLTTGVGNGDGNGFKLGGDGIAVAHVLKNSISFANNANGITSNSNPAVVLENNIAYGNKTNISLYGKGNTERTFKATGNISMAAQGADNYSEQPSLASETNYFFTGAKSVNSKGEELTAAIFKSTDVKIVPERKADGSIDMKGLLETSLAGLNESTTIQVPMGTVENNSSETSTEVSKTETPTENKTETNTEKQTEQTTINNSSNSENEEKGSNAVVWVVLLVVIGAVAGIGYYMYKKKGKVNK